MSIENKLNQLQNTKDEIKTVLTSKGLEPSDVFSTYSTLIQELFKIEYVEGTSDDDGYINSEIAPTGDNILVLSRMYLHPTLNMWCPCVSYESTNGNHIITGGIKYGVSVVVGGSTCQTFPNCTYRVYYIKINS